MFIATDRRLETIARLRRAERGALRARDLLGRGQPTAGVQQLLCAMVDAHDHAQVWAPVLRALYDRQKGAWEIITAVQGGLHDFCHSPESARLLNALDGAVAALQAHALAFEREPTEHQADACQ